MANWPFFFDDYSISLPQRSSLPRDALILVNKVQPFPGCVALLCAQPLLTLGSPSDKQLGI
jgi:hypothetical protein